MTAYFDQSIIHVPSLGGSALILVDVEANGRVRCGRSWKNFIHLGYEILTISNKMRMKGLNRDALAREIYW